MSGILQSLIGSLKSAASAATDAYFNLVTLLLPGDGTNGAQNNTFLDSSSNNFTITRNGNTTQGTFTPFSQTGWSNYFNGSSAINAAASAGFSFTGDYTIEFWFNYSSFPSSVSTWVINTGASNYFALNVVSATSVQVYLNSSTASFTATPATSIALNTWNHIALVRSGSTNTVYVNGVAATGTGTNSGTLGSSTNVFKIGGFSTSSVVGYVSNLRVTKGGALYTGTFTPSTTPLTTTVSSGTVSLLACQSNRFYDVANSASMSVDFGTPSVQSFSPFDPTAAYSTTTVGGSGYFDGTGDYLSIADNVALQFGSGNFTINCWVYRAVSGATHTIASKGASTPTGWVFQINSSNQLVWTDTSTSITTTTTIPSGVWSYVSVVRSGTGTNQTVLYINGTSSATGTSATNFNQTSALNIGADRSNANTFNGYISGLEYVKGTALSISVPTTPPTTSNSPSALLNFTNAGITDATAKNVLETVGNAQISTTQSKFGGSSMAFDGTGDYLSIADSQAWNYGTGNFTIEFWVYFSAFPVNTWATVTSQYVDANNRVSVFFGNNATNENGLVFKVVTGGTVYKAVQNDSASITMSSLGYSTATWYHIAVVRNGSTITGYVDGVSKCTLTTTASFPDLAASQIIGAFSSAADYPLNGYIDDLRITKGYARYTANFTAPTAAFALQ